MSRKLQPGTAKKGTETGRRAGRIAVQAAIEDDECVRSLDPRTQVRRQRPHERPHAEQLQPDHVKVVRDLILPDSITVQELATRRGWARY